MKYPPLKERLLRTMSPSLKSLGSLRSWIEHYCDVLRNQGISDEQRKEQMNQVNPKYVLEIIWLTSDRFCGTR